MAVVSWVVAGALFALGTTMVVIRRQLLAMLFGLELMLCAVNLIVVRAAAHFSHDPDPARVRAAIEAQAVVAIVLAVAAAEAVIGLALILEAHRRGWGQDAGELAELRG